MKLMKRIAAGAVVFAFVLSIASVAFGQNLGYIDVTRVFKEYKETEKAEEVLKEKKEDFEKKFEDAQEKLEKAEKDNKSKEDIEKLREELEKELEPMRKELVTFNEQLTRKLQQDIISAVEKVAKKLGIDIVVDKQVIITGGVDLSEMVINELNK